MPLLFRRRNSNSHSHSRSIRSASPFRRGTKSDPIIDSLSIEQTYSGTTASSSRSGKTVEKNSKRKPRMRARSASPFQHKRKNEKSSKVNATKELNHQSKLESIEKHTTMADPQITEEVRTPPKRNSSRRSRSFSPFRFRRKESDGHKEKKERNINDEHNEKSHTSASKQYSPPRLPKMTQVEGTGANEYGAQTQLRVPPPNDVENPDPSATRNDTTIKLESIGNHTNPPVENPQATKATKNKMRKDSPRRSRSFSPFRRRRKEGEETRTPQQQLPPHDEESRDPSSARNNIMPERPPSRPPSSSTSRPTSRPPSAIKRLFKSNRSKRGTNQGLGRALSFDSVSVMEYPPSKIPIHVNTHKDTNSQFLKHDGMKEKESRSGDKGEAEIAEIDAVDYPVHSMYQNVLEQLRENMNKKKEQEENLISSDPGIDTDKENRERGKRRLSRLNEHLSHSDKSFNDNVRDEQHVRTDQHQSNKTSPTRCESNSLLTNQQLQKHQQLLSTSATKKNNGENDIDKQGYRNLPAVIQVPLGNAHEESQSLSSNSLSSSSQHTVKETINQSYTFSDCNSTRHSASHRRKSQGKRIKVIKKMSSTKSKSSIRRLFKSQPHEDRPKTKMQERRRNFTFMKSPNKKKMSTATMQKKRVRAKQLAELAGSGSPSPQSGTGYSQAEGEVMGMGFENVQTTPRGLNFDALDNESVISGMTSVYDMDMFDDQSVFSSASTFSSRKNKPPMSRNKNRLESFNTSSRRRQPQQSIDMFGGAAKDHFDDAFHPINMKNRISMQNNSPALSETGGLAGLSTKRGQRNTYHSSGASVVSTSSSVSGAAARRLMRRAMKTSQSQPPQQGFNGSTDASVTSEADSQHSGFEDSVDRERQAQDTFAPMNGNIYENGLTFDAFGLDEHQIDDDVNAAIAELAETNPSVSMLMNVDRERDRHAATIETVSTASLSIPSKQSHHFVEENRSIFTDRDYSVSSTLTKSSDSASHNAHKIPSIVEDRYGKSSAHKSENDERSSTVTTSRLSDIGRRNTQTLRYVKERMKAKNVHVSTAKPSHVNKFRSINLPDIGSNDEDSENAYQGSDQQHEEIDNGQLSENPSDEFMAWNTLDKVEDQQTISSQETGSSREAPTEFIPRKQSPPRLNHNASESQKRAQSWAAERSSPILISPLLTPTSKSRKKVTSSQKRAKAWAGECEGSPDVMDRAPPLKAEIEVHQNMKNKEYPSSEVHQSVPHVHQPLPYRPPKPTLFNHLTMDESSRGGGDSSNSFTSEDHEVKAINTPSSNSKKSHQIIGYRLPLPPEKVQLRKTQSPIFRPDYDAFKTSAPTVPLRHVQPRDSPPPKESPNFLSNIKLRKVSTPAPRVEHDKTRPQSDDEEHEVVPQSSDEFLETTPSHEFVQQGSPYRKPQRTYIQNDISKEFRESKSHSTPPLSSHANQNPMLMDNDYNADSQLHTRSVENSSRWETENKSKKEMKSSPQLKNSPAHPVAAMLAARGDKVEIQPNVSRERDSTAHPVAAMFAARANEVESPIQATVSGEGNTVAHPVAAMFAARAKEVKPPAQAIVPGVAAHPVAAMFAARAQLLLPQTNELEDPGRIRTSALAPAPAPSNVSISKSPLEEDDDDNEDLFVEETKTSSMNNVAVLFAQRSAMMNPSSQTEEVSKATPSATAVPEPEIKPTQMNGRVALKDDPLFTKYFKMLKMGLPMGAVQNAMARDGEDPAIMDCDHNLPAGTNSSGIPLKEDPKYAKYFKMMKMGLPMGAIKNAMARDGEDPSVLDGDHNAPATNGSNQEAKKFEPLPKDKYRRTRVHWDTLRQVKSTSVWALVNQDPDIEDIEIDESEFAELFQAEAGQALAVDTNASKSKAVKVIDPKRANNGGIVLARLKITYEEMAVAIDTINDKVMSIEQVQGILEYIPTKQEKQSLRKYMTSSDKDSADAFDDLCECEKFMVAMMTVKHSREKVRALLFKLQFRQCVSDLESDVVLVEKSCDELKESTKLRKLLGIVLNIGNRLNTAGPTNKGKAGAFTIESLLKLNQAKAFDKKTTFLHYIVLVVLRHNDSLTSFKDDLSSVLKSDKIYWDQIETDLEEVENQLENVRKIALHEVFGKRRRSSRKRNKGEDDEMSQDSMSLEEEVEALRSTRIGIFTLQAIKIISALRESVEITRSKFRLVLEYFGVDDNKKMHPHELFKIICLFTKNFMSAKEEVLKLEREKAKQNGKKQRTPIRSQSPSVRSRDSTFSKTSADQDTPRRSERPLRASSMQPHIASTRSEKPLRASSMQPHINAVIMAQPVVPENREDNENYINSNASSASTGSADTIQHQPADEFEHTSRSNVSVKSSISNFSSASEPHTFHEMEVASGHEKMNSDDSREEYDENLVPSFTLTERSNQSQSEEEAAPFHIVERNMSTSHDSSNSASIKNNDAKESISHSSPSAQTMRERARSMRQHRIRSNRETTMDGTPPPTTINRRRPPTPETGARTVKPAPSPASGDRIMTRRERLARRERQRQQRNVSY